MCAGINDVITGSHLPWRNFVSQADLRDTIRTAQNIGRGAPNHGPPPHCVNGDWPSILARLYAIFTVDFKDQTCSFQGCAVDWDKRIASGDNYEEGFWHLVTKTDHRTGDRLLDPRRAERLPWCSPTIRNSPHVAIKACEYLESGNRRRVYIWLEEWDYVVILEKRMRKDVVWYFLVTAFHVDGGSTRRSLSRKHTERQRS
jgi:hypothetical protein